MKLITELTEDVQYVKEDVGDGKKAYFIEGVFMQAELKNRNGRKYPLRILESQVAKYVQTHVQKRRAYGELGHPQGPTINLDRVSHLITDLRKEGNDFIGRAKIITENPSGRIVKNLIDEGCQLGVSSRGMGSLVYKNGVNEVQDDFVLATPADIVADPSAPSAFVNGIMEGVEWIYENERWIRVAEEAKKEVQRLPAKRITESKLAEIFEGFLRKL